ncbi:MAG: hypothetical protein HS105_12455 [Chloracidobacterium sp.]|nr:hypothetical protein [Chloracidobacterium sp.]MCC6825720.1 hypothetical protein [Acidobacteriota bacterium]MCO5332872.1 hypothetical protein [Pyrinomonadaceae bacterium]
MTELDALWAEMIAAAAENATGDAAAFLRLRAANDKLRTAGVGWLIDSMIAVAQADLIRELIVERDEPHSFREGNSNLVGTRLTLRQGVRCLSVEAGWTRTPSDGIMRGGALAAARLSHFGMPRNDELIRLAFDRKMPHWITADGSRFELADCRRHFEIFLG